MDLKQVVEVQLLMPVAYMLIASFRHYSSKHDLCVLATGYRPVNKYFLPVGALCSVHPGGKGGGGVGLWVDFNILLA